MNKNLIMIIAVVGIVGIGALLIMQGQGGSQNQNPSENKMESDGTTVTNSESMEGETTMTDKNIVQVAQDAGNFSTLVAAVQAAGLVETLSGEGPFTVLAPTDEAFAKLPEGTVEELLLPENKEKLVSILTYHVIPGKVMAADVAGLSSATTVQGSDVTIDASSGTVMIDNAKVVTTDIEASNGVIHVIDTVIMPK